MGALKELGFLASSHKVSAELNENSSNENLIKSIVLGGLHPRIAVRASAHDILPQ